MKSSLAGGAAFALYGCGAARQPGGKIVGANNRLRIAVAGVNGQGSGHMNGWLDQENVELAYLIDPDAQVLEKRLAQVKERAGDRFACKGVVDIRTALDAISIATPNHWHS